MGAGDGRVCFSPLRIKKNNIFSSVWRRYAGISRMLKVSCFPVYQIFLPSHPTHTHNMMLLFVILKSTRLKAKQGRGVPEQVNYFIWGTRKRQLVPPVGERSSESVTILFLYIISKLSDSIVTEDFAILEASLAVRVLLSGWTSLVFEFWIH